MSSSSESLSDAPRARLFARRHPDCSDEEELELMDGIDYALGSRPPNTIITFLWPGRWEWNYNPNYMFTPQCTNECDGRFRSCPHFYCTMCNTQKLKTDRRAAKPSWDLDQMLVFCKECIPKFGELIDLNQKRPVGRAQRTRKTPDRFINKVY